MLGVDARGMLHLGTFAHSSSDGPGRVRQILAIELVEFGRRPRCDGRDQVGGVELAPRVGPDRIAEVLGVEAVQRS